MGVQIGQLGIVAVAVEGVLRLPLDEDQHLAIGLDHVRGRLPGRGLRPAACGLKELAV